MKIGSLFTGYGGLDLAVEQHVNGSLEWYAEIEPAACKILEELHPGVPNLGDVTKIDWSTVPPVDVITGGYPCQPFSHAGNRKGKNDERHLWPYVRDAIRTIRPRFAVLENVRGHVSLGFADVLADLATIGFDAEWGTFRASDVGAPHRRERLFIIAYSTRGSGGERSGWGVPESERSTRLATYTGSPTADTEHDGLNGGTVTRSISESENERRLQQPERRDSDLAADTDSDGHGKQLHSRRMASVEGQATDSTQQWQRSRRESDPGSVDDAANTAGSGLQGSDVWDATRKGSDQPSTGGTRSPDTDWGKYAPAITRWGFVLDRSAPEPTVEHKNKRRLNPQFVEWMMGLDEGHVTGHGLSSAQELKMLGNGVVPQQARAAIAQLMGRIPA